MNPTHQIKILVVDDSPNVRLLLKKLLEVDPAIIVTGLASDPYHAAELMAHEIPDVITLDLQMPRMGGLTFLKKLMNQHPLPVVVVSSFTEDQKDLAMWAYALGASAVITKPVWKSSADLEQYGMQLRDAVIAASFQNMLPGRRLYKEPVRHLSSLPVNEGGVQKLVLMGASTGGTEVIARILGSLQGNIPPVLIVQHMPGEFTGAFAKRLHNECALTVKEAERNEALQNNHVYIANGFYHLVVKKIVNDYVCDLNDGEPVNRHRPSVDVLFRSAAAFADKNMMAVLLTGMGADGAKGLLELRKLGAVCIAQDEKSCAVYGMPREAVLLNAANLVGNPGEIIEWMSKFAEVHD